MTQEGPPLPHACALLLPTRTPTCITAHHPPPPPAGAGRRGGVRQAARAGARPAHARARAEGRPSQPTPARGVHARGAPLPAPRWAYKRARKHFPKVGRKNKGQAPPACETFTASPVGAAPGKKIRAVEGHKTRPSERGRARGPRRGAARPCRAKNSPAAPGRGRDGATRWERVSTPTRSRRRLRGSPRRCGRATCTRRHRTKTTSRQVRSRRCRTRRRRAPRSTPRAPA